VRLGQLKAKVMQSWAAVAEDLEVFGGVLQEALKN
jgi:hypothetical protein